MRRGPRVLTALWLTALLAVSGCIGGGSAPSASPSASGSSSAPTPAGLPDPVARIAFQTDSGGAGGDQSKVFTVASAYGLYRQGRYVTLLLGVGYQGVDPGNGISVEPAGLLASTSGAVEDGSNVSGLNLVDPAAARAYLPARTASGTCVCSTDHGLYTSTAPVTQALVQAVFAAPPSGVRTLDVVIPRVGLLPGVPVTNAPVPSGGAGTITPQPTPLPTDPPARADVVDLTLPIANLDKSVTQEKDKLLLAADVLFAYDRAKLTATGRDRIDEAAQILRARASGPVSLDGYTDARGSDAYNQRLSEKRAAAVKDELATRVRGAGLTLSAAGHGEADPVAPNTVGGKDNPKGRALNRRVEVRYQPKASPTPTATSGSAPPSASGSSPAAATAVPTPGQVIASREVTELDPGSQTRYKIELFRLYRHGRLATLDFGLVNESDSTQVVSTQLSRDLEANVSGVSLADEPGRKLYLAGSYPLQAGKSQPAVCLCSSGMLSTGPGQTLYLTASFAAPPAGKNTIDVRLPHQKPFKDVPITG